MPNFLGNLQVVANGDIGVSLFVMLDTSRNNAVLQCSAATLKPIGISQAGPKIAPNFIQSLGGTLSTAWAANQGDQLEIFTPGDVCLLTLGGTVTAGDLLTSDANGKGVTASAGNLVGAIALQSGVSGDLIKVVVQPPFKA